MIHNNVELHNVTEVQEVKGGFRLQRVPEDVRMHLNVGAQTRALQPENCEIRLVCDSGECSVTLSSEGLTNASVFYGTFDGRQRLTIGKEPQTIELEPHERLRMLDKKYWKDLAFAPNVCRVILGGRQREPIILHNVEGKNIRLPLPEELPEIRYLAYGTSITQGFDCEGAHLSYIARTAHMTGADLINLGMAGACHCEEAFADHIAERDDWDIASLAISVNMDSFPIDEYRKRISYMVSRVGGTRRPVACITIFPYHRDFDVDDVGYAATTAEYRQGLRDAVAECGLPNVHLIEGPEMLTDIGGLTHDLLHPGDSGMLEMSVNLSERLKPILPAVNRRTAHS